jgi:thiol:disulfide interchange protein DsbA
MRILLLLTLALLFGLSSAFAADIRGYYDEIGNLPAPKSVEKVRFEEFMNFGCPHCNNLHQASEKLREEYADRVEFIDVPIAFRGQDDAPVRLYYVAESLGRGEEMKRELFKTRFEYGVDVFDKGIANYLAQSMGIADEYREQAQESWVTEKIADSMRRAERYGITGTPTVVIEGSMKMDIGKYRTMESFAEKVPETIEDLLVQQ